MSRTNCIRRPIWVNFLRIPSAARGKQNPETLNFKIRWSLNLKFKVSGFCFPLAALGILRKFTHIGRLMQFVRDIYVAKAAAGQPVILFEFFPPNWEEGE